VPDLSKASRLIGFQPERSLDDVIDDILHEESGRDAAPRH
jgi:nucleoside-diphosphate-sugar epimerase